MEGVVGGTGGVCVRVEGRGGISIICGNKVVNGLIRKNASEILLKSLRSAGVLMVAALVGEAGELSKEAGDEGVEDTRLIALFCGKTVMPHLLVGRTGAGISDCGVTGELGSDGGVGGTTMSTDFSRTGEVERLRAWSLAKFGGVVDSNACEKPTEVSVVV